MKKKYNKIHDVNIEITKVNRIKNKYLKESNRDNRKFIWYHRIFCEFFDLIGYSECVCTVCKEK